MSGHVYLLGMENGKVKVGSSRYPELRITCHRNTLGKVSPIVGEWTSPMHRDYQLNERKIIIFMGSQGEIASADYEEVLRYAQSLKFAVPRKKSKGINQ